MLCRSVSGKRMLLSGAVLLAVGLSRFLSAPGAGGVTALILGVLAGMGGSFVCVGAVRLALQKKKTSGNT